MEKRLTSAGWLMNRFGRDYGFDFIGQLTEEEHVTGDIALFQVKAATRPLKPRADGFFRLRVLVKHLDLWRRLGVPCFVAIVEINSDTVYLADCRRIVKDLKTRRRPRGVSVTVKVNPKSKLNARVGRQLREDVAKFWRFFRIITLQYPIVRPGRIRFRSPDLPVVSEIASTMKYWSVLLDADTAMTLLETIFGLKQAPQERQSVVEACRQYAVMVRKAQAQSERQSKRQKTHHRNVVPPNSR